MRDTATRRRSNKTHTATRRHPKKNLNKTNRNTTDKTDHPHPSPSIPKGEQFVIPAKAGI